MKRHNACNVPTRIIVNRDCTAAGRVVAKMARVEDEEAEANVIEVRLQYFSMLIVS